MATSFTKTYSVTVTFTKGAPSADLTDADIQSVELRNEIQNRIAKAARISKGVYSAQPGSVSEV